MKPLLAFLVGVFLSGCVDYQQPSSTLPIGASKAAVQALIGSPKSKSRDGSLSTWNYGGGTVCVFKDNRLVASNVHGSPRSLSAGAALTPASAEPAPYYAPAVYATPGYYAGAWPVNERYPIRQVGQVYTTPGCFSRRYGWSGWWYPWWGGYGWFGYPKPYYAGNFWRYNNCHGNYYRGNYYEGKLPASTRR